MRCTWRAFQPASFAGWLAIAHKSAIVGLASNFIIFPSKSRALLALMQCERQRRITFARPLAELTGRTFMGLNYCRLGEALLRLLPLLLERKQGKEERATMRF